MHHKLLFVKCCGENLREKHICFAASNLQIAIASNRNRENLRGEN